MLVQNFGSYTILACSVVGAKGVAFEPVPSTFNRLVENMHLNHLDERVKCINKGVGRQLGVINFTSGDDTTNHAIAPGEQCDSAVTVEVTSLDAQLKGDSPSLLKIDVEGYETPVLEGAHETSKKPTLHSVIMELNGSGSRYEYDESRIIELMLDYDFKTYSYNPLERKLVDLKGKNLRSGNTLFIRDKSFVVERLMDAPKVLVSEQSF